jgi:hypothetical protein
MQNIKILEKETEEMLQSIEMGKVFVVVFWEDPKSLGSFYTAKRTIRVKRQPTEWNKTFANYAFDQGLISDIP